MDSLPREQCATIKEVVAVGAGYPTTSAQDRTVFRVSLMEVAAVNLHRALIQFRAPEALRDDVGHTVLDL